MRRGGFTLVELLIAMVLLAMLGLGVTATLESASRVSTRALTRLAVGRTMLTTGALLREELANAASDEVAIPAANVVDLFRRVGSGPPCGESGATVMLRQSDWFGARLPVANRDLVLLLVDIAAGSWSALSLAAVGSGHCPDGTPAIQLTLGTVVGPVSYLQVVEPVHMRSYLSGGVGWWGLAPASGLSPVQPFAGPLTSPLGSGILMGPELRLLFHPQFGNDTTLRFPLGVP